MRRSFSMNILVVPEGHISLFDAVQQYSIKWRCTRDEAFRKLRPLLCSGQMPAFELEGSQVRETSPAGWGDEENDNAFDTGKYVRRLGSFRTSRHEAMLRLDDIELFDGALEREPMSVPAATSKGRGRKQASGGDRFWIEVCRLIHAGECVPGQHKQTDFIARMQAWSKANGDIYASDTVVDKVKAMWAATDHR